MENDKAGLVVDDHALGQVAVARVVLAGPGADQVTVKSWSPGNRGRKGAPPRTGNRWP